MSFPSNDNEVLFQKLASYCLLEMDAAERQQMEAWIASSAANKKQYEAVQQLLQQNSPLEAITVDTDKGWTALNDKISTLQEVRRGKVRSLRWYGAAAAVITALLAGGWFLFQSAGSNKEQWIAKTAFDTLLLADGSMVIADGRATIKYKDDFNKGNREVQLEGNAFFKVHRDTAQPFSVAFNEGKVTVLGTQFKINQQLQGFEVKVTEGKVRAMLLDQESNVVLTRGRSAVFDKAKNQFQVQDFAEASMLKYTNETLQTILKDIFLAKGILVKADPSLASTKLTVDFINSQPDEIVQALALLTQGQLKRTGTNEYQLISN
jgi:transmembrane sensor